MLYQPRKYIPCTYLQYQLSTNMHRIKKLAELQSKLILKDLSNNQLKDHMVKLQSENDLLKRRLEDGDRGSKIEWTKKKERKERDWRAISRAQEVLRDRGCGKERWESTIRKQYRCCCESQRKDREREGSVGEEERKSRYAQSKRSASNVCDYTPQTLKLHKQVYKQPQTPRQPQPKPQIQTYQSPVTHQITFKKQQPTQPVYPIQSHNIVINKFPSQLQQFHNHSAINKFQNKQTSYAYNQHQNRPVQNAVASSIYQRWQSEEDVPYLNTQMAQRLDRSSQRRKRKMFMSVVSQSSRHKKL